MEALIIAAVAGNIAAVYAMYVSFKKSCEPEPVNIIVHGAS